jgi:Cellulose binding domain
MVSLLLVLTSAMDGAAETLSPSVSASPTWTPSPTTTTCTAVNGTVETVTATSITFRLPGSTCVPQAIFYVSLFTSEAAARANTPVAASGLGSRQDGRITVTGLSPDTAYWFRFQMPAPAPVAGPVRTTAPPTGCSATARIDSEWGAGQPWAGQIVSVQVRNTSTAALPAWSVSWPLAPQQDLGTGWGARIRADAGTLTATSADPGRPLNAGETVTFGVQLTGVGPTPTPVCRSTAVGRVVNLTEADSGRTVTLTSGDTLTVALSADYDPIRLSPASPAPLVPVTATGGYPTGSPLTATYRADAAGAVDLRTSTDYDCFHAVPPCARPVRLWTVHVVVTPA